MKMSLFGLILLLIAVGIAIGIVVGIVALIVWIVKTIKKSNKQEPVPTNTSSMPDATPEQLKKLKQMYEDGLITEEEYSEKRKAILEKM